MRERRLQQVRSILAQEYRVADIWIRHRRGVEQRHSNLIRLHQLEHPSQKHALKLEATLMIRIGQDEEDILHDAEEVLLEEGV